MWSVYRKYFYIYFTPDNQQLFSFYNFWNKERIYNLFQTAFLNKSFYYTAFQVISVKIKAKKLWV